MENETTLLAGFMFITIITIGLGNLLLTLSDIVTGQTKTLPSATHLAWMVLLLLGYFGFYWDTTYVLKIETWNYTGFVAFLSGPVLLLFATNLLSRVPSQDQDAKEFYISQSDRFFALMIGVQVWVVGLDIFFESSTIHTWIDIAIGATYALLIASGSYKLHSGVVWVMAMLMIGRMVLEATGL